MSFTESTTAVESDPQVAPEGHVEAEAAAPAAPEAPVLDITQYQDHLVPVKVAGEEQYVPLSQVQQGLMMQADYTRKTQQLAEERAAVQEAIAIAEALQNDPASTLKVLQEWYQVGGESAEDDLESLDPLEREIKELQTWREQQESERQIAQLQSELDSFHERYGVDQGELLAFAVENEIPNLDWAYAVMSQAREAAVAEHQAEREAAEAARLAGKQQAAVVSGGSGLAPQAQTVPMGSRENVRSVADAARLAMQQLGIR